MVPPEHHVFRNRIGVEVNSFCADMKRSGASLVVLIMYLHEHAERNLRSFIFLSLSSQSSHKASSRSEGFTSRGDIAEVSQLGCGFVGRQGVQERAAGAGEIRDPSGDCFACRKT
jgi:hypothetical protein